MNSNEEYERENLLYTTLQNLHIHHIIIQDHRGRVVKSVSADPDADAEQLTPTPESITSLCSAGGAGLVPLDADDSREGIVYLEDRRFLIFASHAILPSEANGPSHGAITFARYLTASRMTELCESLQCDVTLTPGADPAVSLQGRIGGASALHRPETPASSRTAIEPGQTAPSILLAEDGPDNQRLIGFFLRKAGFAVTVADNGATACDLALAAESEGAPFDAILMDMQMPILGGYSATSKLRREGYTRPIIALTAHAMPDDRDRCIMAGCTEYATKPIQRDLLIKQVNDAIRGLHPTGS